VYIYAIASGLVGLGIPLAVQTIVQLISSGRLLEPIILLTAFVIFSTFISGFLQIKQAEIVELIQQRLFAKASFEFALRIPRLRLEAITDTHAPELMNRFMDIVKVQSGIAKILTDFIAAILQIVFGLMLLAFYHPFFLIFGLVLAVTLFLIFYITGPRGLQYSIEVSKYKYKILHWIEDISHSLASFKLAGFTTLPYEQMDKHLAGYLTKRAKYFKVIKGQMLASVIFKTVITGSLLVLGYVLLTAREITLGQFVASELVILLVLGSVEKLMMNLTLVYDILTSLDKIGHVTDLPLDRAGGIPFPEADANASRGVHIRVKDLGYTYPNQHHPALSEITFSIAAGERIAIAGAEGAGRTTLLHLLAGLYDNFTGILTFDNIAFQDLELYSFRDCIGEYWTSGQIFQGTVYQNIAMGKPGVTPKDVLEALERVNLLDTVNSWPRGLHTQLTSSGKGLPDDVARRIIIARALAEHPRLFILDDGALRFEGGVSPAWIDRLFDCRDAWTMVLATNNPRLLNRCDKVLWLDHGHIKGFDSYEELLKKPNFARRFGRTELTKLAE
jgi:ABC-type bacteriocin/lantibiotic exporter with double-glycine peptidase domain